MSISPVPLVFLAQCQSKGEEPLLMVSWLLSVGANPNAENIHGETPFHMAARRVSFQQNSEINTFFSNTNVWLMHFFHASLTYPENSAPHGKLVSRKTSKELFFFFFFFRKYYPGQKKEPSLWCITWYRRICSLISLRCIGAWSRGSRKSHSLAVPQLIKHLDSSISQDSDFMHQQHGSFFCPG